MKISQVYKKYDDICKSSLKIIKKGAFYILLEEEAFFMSKVFNLKLTKLDNETIKVGFPVLYYNKWSNILIKKDISFVVIEKLGEDYEIIKTNNGKIYSRLYQINLEDYILTKNRILGLGFLDLEQKKVSNFLLEQKIEDLYILNTDLLIRLPKKERYYFRDKIERLFIELLESVYKYKYDLLDRNKLIQKIFDDILILREYFRFLHRLGKIKNDNVYLDIGDRFVEILKICKGIKNKF